MHWPEGSGTFRINPTRTGNGVKPIKDGFILSLEACGWQREQKYDEDRQKLEKPKLPRKIRPVKDPLVTAQREAEYNAALLEYQTQLDVYENALAEQEELERSRPGSFDARRHLDAFDLPPFIAEWETGNISSSHRALNKMTMALQEGRIAGGVLVLPSRALYRFLTDRVGNYQEIAAYFDFYRRLAATVQQGFLAVIEIEHDEVDENVPLIEKGTDGRALV